MSLATNELIMVGGLVINFAGTLIAISRARLKTESRLTHLETLMELMVRGNMPPGFRYRTTDDLGAHG